MQMISPEIFAALITCIYVLSAVPVRMYLLRKVYKSRGPITSESAHRKYLISVICICFLLAYLATQSVVQGSKLFFVNLKADGYIETIEQNYSIGILASVICFMFIATASNAFLCIVLSIFSISIGYWTGSYYTYLKSCNIFIPHHISPHKDHPFDLKQLQEAISFKKITDIGPKQEHRVVDDVVFYRTNGDFWSSHAFPQGGLKERRAFNDLIVSTCVSIPVIQKDAVSLKEIRW